eukprot:TRINITY_DN782011_c0_g1_i1.p1 TRINITY_DN782011_c0_g1~~TRINITY_DN782011_c0_g1_i1.p1  ORF type:complete len:251 (-),score=72.18 TRINITY_DN782011_c0_g1_i1:114-866(-)
MKCKKKRKKWRKKEMVFLMTQLEAQEDINQEVEKLKDIAEAKLAEEKKSISKLKNMNDDILTEVSQKKHEISSLKKFIDDSSLNRKKEALLKRNEELKKENNDLEAEIDGKPRKLMLSKFCGANKKLQELNKDVNALKQRKLKLCEEINDLKTQIQLKAGFRFKDMIIEKESSYFRIKQKCGITSYGNIKYEQMDKFGVVQKDEICSIFERIQLLVSEESRCSRHLDVLGKQFESEQKLLVGKFVTNLFF